MRISAEDELENTRGERFMKRAIWIVIMLVLLLGAKPANAADNRFIVRTNGGLPLIQGVCALLGCNVVYGLDGSLNQLFLVTAPSSIDPNALLAILQSQLGVVAVELDRLVGLGAGLAEASAPPAGLWNSSPVNYYGATVWAGYVNQPAAGIVRVSDTQKAFNVAGAGIVADIDTGVDPNHPALRNVLLTGYVSDILRAIYYAVQNKAKVINMSFDFTTYSKELARSMNYANRAGVICVASAGNDGKDELVYPAGLTNLVMGIASTSDADTRSSFSNYGQDIVWVAAPGEAIITTYPFSTYAAGSGTSFSAPLVSGGAALLLSVQMNCNQYQASQAIAHAKLLSPDLGHGRLDLYQSVTAWRTTLGLH